MNIKSGLQILVDEFGKDRVNKAIEAVKKFQVELPSWAFGNFGGGRFGKYTPPAAAKNIQEKLDDAAFIQKLTGATPKVSTNVLWDFSDDEYNECFDIAKEFKKEAKKRNLDMGAVNPTYFLAGSYRRSLSSDEKETRKRYIKQTLFAARVAKEFGNKILIVWLPDGSLYPGQLELTKAYNNLRNSLKEIRKSIPKDIKILIEYKLFEPGLYSTTVSDWGTSALLAKNIGGNTGVLVDLGHHHSTANIEQIVSYLISEGIPGGFHFNARYAADDDLAVEPNQQNARIFYELLAGNVVVNNDKNKNWAYMLDQCSSRENRMHAILHSIDSLQLSLAKAMLVNKQLLDKYQKNDDIILANRLFNDALLNADVRPIVYKARIEKGLPVDPLNAYIKSGYQQRIEKERK